MRERITHLAGVFVVGPKSCQVGLVPVAAGVVAGQCLDHGAGDKIMAVDRGVQMLGDQFAADDALRRGRPEGGFGVAEDDLILVVGQLVQDSVKKSRSAKGQAVHVARPGKGLLSLVGLVPVVIMSA